MIGIVLFLKLARLLDALPNSRSGGFPKTSPSCPRCSTSLPQLSIPKEPDRHVVYVPFAAPVPTRRVVLAWRRTFTRYEAIAALRNAIYACPLLGVKRLS